MAERGAIPHFVAIVLTARYYDSTCDLIPSYPLINRAISNLLGQLNFNYVFKIIIFSSLFSTWKNLSFFDYSFFLLLSPLIFASTQSLYIFCLKTRTLKSFLFIVWEQILWKIQYLNFNNFFFIITSQQRNQLM